LILDAPRRFNHGSIKNSVLKNGIRAIKREVSETVIILQMMMKAIP
jgi:hypothetical protein